MPRSPYSQKLITLFILLMVCIWSAFPAAAQRKQGQALIDSLNADLQHAESDSQKFYLLTRLCLAYGTVDADKGAQYGSEALALARKTKSEKRMANALYYRGYCWMYASKYPEALEDFLTALPIFERVNDQDKIAGTLSNVGGIYSYQGKNDLALDYYLKALNINRKVSDSSNFEVANLVNIGLLYVEKKDWTNALRYHHEALGICEAQQYMDMLPAVVVSLSDIYVKLNDNTKAYRFADRAMKLAAETGALNVSANAFLNQGIAALQAMEANDRSLTDSLRASGIQNPLSFARNRLDSAIHLAKAMGSMSLLTEAYNKSAELEEFRGDFRAALQFHKQYKLLNDSMFNDQNKEKILQSSMEYEYERRETANKAAQEKKDMRQRAIRNSIAAGLLLVLVFAIVVYRQRNRIASEKKRSDDLLLNILPMEVAEELKAKGEAEAKQLDEVTVLFTDFKEFTQLSERLSPKELVAEIDECFRAFDNIVQKYGVEKIKTIGDSYMAAGGLPIANKTHAEDVVKSALEIQEFMHKHKKEREAGGRVFFEIRIGIHTGPVVAGIVGVKKFAYDIWGDTVNTASRMESSGEAGRINISETTYLKVNHKFNCVHRGKISAKGKGEIDMYFVEGMI